MMKEGRTFPITVLADDAKSSSATAKKTSDAETGSISRALNQIASCAVHRQTDAVRRKTAA
ncbi:hypothetical protein [Fulvimarina sp. MAC3]|uniref:hypothetical protein n=1 Tax=Fulvimarina sp. MAC3 TaxID=3148887 RepID=UPI0031FDAB38